MHIPRWSHWASWVSLGLPFGCGKDNRSGLRNYFPTAPDLQPETKFLFSGGFTQEWDRPMSPFGVIIGPRSEEHGGRLLLQLYVSVSFHLCCYCPDLSHHHLLPILLQFSTFSKVQPFKYYKPSSA